MPSHVIRKQIPPSSILDQLPCSEQRKPNMLWLLLGDGSTGLRIGAEHRLRVLSVAQEELPEQQSR